jgi:hypothetical protein
VPASQSDCSQTAEDSTGIGPMQGEITRIEVDFTLRGIIEPAAYNMVSAFLLTLHRSHKYK